MTNFEIDKEYAAKPAYIRNDGESFLKFEEKMKNFNTERIEIALIFSGVFLCAYLFCMACASIWEALKLCF